MLDLREKVPIIDKKRYGVSHQFKIVLHDVALAADVSETTAAKAHLAAYSEAIVTIVHDGTSKELMDKVLCPLKLGRRDTSGWKGSSSLDSKVDGVCLAVFTGNEAPRD